VKSNGEETRQRAERSLTAVTGVMALVAVLLVVQMWLLTATLESYLAGHYETALPGAIISGVLFAGCAGLYGFLARIDRNRDPNGPR
jgi:hypothetical protein